MNDGNEATATASPANGPITEFPTDEQCRCPKCRKVSVQAVAGPNEWRRYCTVCDGHFWAGDTVLVPRKKTAASVAREFPPSIPALQEAAGHRDPAEVQPAPAVTVTLMEGIFDPAQKVSLADFASPGPGTGAVDPCSTLPETITAGMCTPGSGTKLVKCAGCGRVTTVDVGCDATHCADCHRERAKSAPVPMICTFPGCEERALSAGTGAMAGEYRCGPHFRELSKEFRALMQAVSDTYLEKLGAEVDATFEVETPAEEDVRLLQEQLAKERARIEELQESLRNALAEIDRRKVQPLNVPHEARSVLAERIFLELIRGDQKVSLREAALLAQIPLENFSTVEHWPKACANLAFRYADAFVKKGGA